MPWEERTSPLIPRHLTKTWNRLKVSDNYKDWEIKLLHLSRRVRELMVITKLLTVFDVHENESEALDSFRSSHIIMEELSPSSLKGAAPFNALTP